MPKISIFGRLTTIHILLHTLFKGKKAGTDDFGNVYFTGKPRRGQKQQRRWVLYKGAPEASSVPPEWHGWLHHQTDVLPAHGNPYRQPWQKPHRPNMTGTAQAYAPPSLKGQARATSTGDYTPWQPPR